MDWRERWHRVVDVAIELRLLGIVSSMRDGYRVAARGIWAGRS